MNEDNLHSWVDPELEARLVALVLGEASDFEREELERLMEELPELALFMKRMEAVSDLLHGKADDSEGGGTADDGEWKLPDEKRRELLAAIDDGEESTEEVGPEPEITEPDGGAVVETIPPAKRQGGRKNLPWNRIGKIAAVLCVVGTLLWMSLPAYQSIRRLAPSESAKTEDARHWAYRYDGAAGGEKSAKDGWTNYSPVQPKPVALAATAIPERQSLRRETADTKNTGDSATSSLNNLRDSFASYAGTTDAPASGPATSSDDLMALHNFETSTPRAGDVSVKDIEETVRTANPVPMPAAEENRSKLDNFSASLAKTRTLESKPATGQASVSSRQSMPAAIADTEAKSKAELADPAEKDLGEVREGRYVKGYIGHGGRNLNELAKMPAISPEAAEASAEGEALLASNRAGTDHFARKELSRLKLEMPKTQAAPADRDGDGVIVPGKPASVVSVNGTVAVNGGDGGRVTLSAEAAQARTNTAVDVSGALFAGGMTGGGVIPSVDDLSNQVVSPQSVTKAPALPGGGGGGGVQAGGNPAPVETPPVAMISVAQAAPVALPASDEPAAPNQNQKSNKSTSLLSTLEADSKGREDFGMVSGIADLDAVVAMPEAADKNSGDPARWGVEQRKEAGQASARGVVAITDGRRPDDSGQVPKLGEVPLATRLYRSDAEKTDASIEPPVPQLNEQQQLYENFDKKMGNSVADTHLNEPDEGDANSIFARRFRGGAENLRGFDSEEVGRVTEIEPRSMVEREQMETTRGEKASPMTVTDEAGTEYLVDALQSDMQAQVMESREQLEELQERLVEDVQPALKAQTQALGKSGKVASEAGATEKYLRPQMTIQPGMDFKSAANNLTFESESGAQPAKKHSGHGQVTPIQIEGNIKTKDTVIRRELAITQQAEQDVDGESDAKKKIQIAAKFVEVDERNSAEMGFDWLLNQPQADGRSNGRVGLGAPGGTIRNEGSITANTANGSGGEIHVDTTPGNFTAQNSDAVFDAARDGSTRDYLYGNLGVERQERLPDGWSDRVRGAGQVSNGNLQAAEQLAAPQEALKGIEDAISLDWEKNIASTGPVTGGAVDRNLGRFEPAQHEWQRNPGESRGNVRTSGSGDLDGIAGWKGAEADLEGFDYEDVGKKSDGPVSWTGSTTWYAGNIAADAQEWKEGFSGAVDRKFIYPTEYDPPEISNSSADISVNAGGDILIRSGDRHGDSAQVGHGGGTNAWIEDRPLPADAQFGAGGYGAVRGFETRNANVSEETWDFDGGATGIGRLQGTSGNINVLDDDDVRLVKSRYGKTTTKGGAVTMKTPDGRGEDYSRLGFRDTGRTFAVNKVAPPAGLDEKNAATESFSTFSLHVSDVSFKLAQAALANGEWPEADKIRIEEFVNAFDYGDPMPSQEDKVACNLEQAAHPFIQQRNLLRVSMKTAAAGRAGDTPLRLTLLLDNSGSMERADRQESVRRAFALLADQLQPIDQVTLISFARQPRLIADKVSGDKSRQLVQIVGNMPAEGGTNLEAALELAFEKAQEQKADKAQNRIVLLTDGAANLGDAKPESLALMIDAMREAGIAFDAAGIGADGLNDETLETLTRKGDGRYYFLDRPEDADDGFARQIAGALRPAAKNVKVQVEFNPDRVGNYKLLGFEKHRLKKEDFRNDAVDAAEMAAEEAGVAVYQFEAKPDGQGDIGFVSVRFLDMSSGKMIEKRWPIPYRPNAPRPDQSSDSLKIATAAAMLGAKLKGGPLGESVDLDELAQLVSSLPDHCQSRERVQQLGQMIDQARQLAGK